MHVRFCARGVLSVLLLSGCSLDRYRFDGRDATADRFVADVLASDVPALDASAPDVSALDGTPDAVAFDGPTGTDAAPPADAGIACDPTELPPANAVFVSPSNMSASPDGTASNPFPSLALAIQEIERGAADRVIVLDPAVYRGTLTFAATRRSHHVRGGFRSVGASWSRACMARRDAWTLGGDVDRVVDIRAEATGAVTFEDLVIQTRAVAAPQQSQYGVFVRSSAPVMLRRVDVIAGPGGAGAMAAMPPTASGFAACDRVVCDPTANAGLNGANGAIGGVATTGTMTPMGYLGGEGRPGSPGEPGFAGRPGTAGTPSMQNCVECIGDVCGNASATGCSGLMSCTSAQTPRACQTMRSTLSATSGRCGCGGVGGPGGGGGGGGGASIALFIASMTARVNLVSSALRAGPGGDGAPGAVGGMGASGQAPEEGIAACCSTACRDNRPCNCVVDTVVCATRGTAGTMGGTGGTGGTGGPGAGGPSAAIVHPSGLTLTMSPDTTLTASAGGRGASRMGTSAPDGPSAPVIMF
jgi:hypothetical protein